MTISLKVNGSQRSVPAEADTPLLYVLRNDLALNGAKFGCGLAQCGACTVLLDGRAVRACVTEIGTIGEAEITTIEGLGTVDTPHPLQQAPGRASMPTGRRRSLPARSSWARGSRRRWPRSPPTSSICRSPASR
jgi:aerobic-type carbon monoxide dehydrogenase small subunit (CoxS/CutS family)